MSTSAQNPVVATSAKKTPGTSPDSTVTVTRKYGLHLLQAPYIHVDNEDNDTAHLPYHLQAHPHHARRNQSPRSSIANMEQDGPLPVSESAVERYLDEHSDFLESYVQRKVHRNQLESWLFRPTGAGGRPNNAPASKMSKDSLVSGPVNSFASQIKRQRSRSFTPLRRLSASRFEEVSSPILITDLEGQPSFLRTNAGVSVTQQLRMFSSSLPDTTGNGSNAKKKVSRKNTAPKQKQEDYLSLLEELFRQKDSINIVEKLNHGLVDLLDGDQARVLLTNTENTLSGDLYTLDKTGHSTRSKSSASKLMTAVITSRQIMNVSNPDLTVTSNDGEEQLVNEVLMAPIINQDTKKSFGVIQVVVTNKNRVAFSHDEESMMSDLSRFASLALQYAIERKETRLELTRSEVFLELAHTVFDEQNRIEPTIRTILSNFLTMIECERCQILLSSQSDDKPQPGVFQRVFDLQRSDLDEEGDAAPSEGRFPINAVIAGEVALTGKKINIPNLQEDSRFDSNLNQEADGLTHKSILCMPIKESSTHRVLGVISLINKEKDGVFTANDERFVEAFSLFCGMAIRNAAAFERAILSEAKLKVAFETMNYQASSTTEEADELAKQVIPSAAAMKLDLLHFNYMGMSDWDTYKATIRMFTDMGLLSHFKIDYHTICRWTMTVKKNYRNDTVKYHNWHHAFNVTQMMFSMLKKTGWDRQFSKIDCLGLLIATLCHDLDHRGTTNAFQAKMKNPLATLYSSSTLERHHLNQCLLLLNVPGNRILEHLSEREYTLTLSVIERNILATDLAHHFSLAKDIRSLSERASSGREALQLGPSDDNPEHKSLVQCALMTAADLGATTKPWAVHRHVSHLVSEEFWEQGDLERATFDETLPPMMDRQASLAQVQIDFINNVAYGVYDDLSKMSGSLEPLKQRCLENKDCWRRLDAEEEERKNRVSKNATMARNL